MLEGLEIMDTFLAFFGVYLVACGLATLVTGNVYGHGQDFSSKYTSESIRAVAPLLGIGTTLTGAALILFKLVGWLPALEALSVYAWGILICGAIVGIAIIGVGYHKLVEKRAR